MHDAVPASPVGRGLLAISDVDARHLADAAVWLNSPHAKATSISAGKARCRGAPEPRAIHPLRVSLPRMPISLRRERAWVVTGPPARAIEMYDKIAAKNAVAADVPVVFGAARAGLTDDALVAAAAGYPGADQTVGRR